MRSVGRRLPGGPNASDGSRCHFIFGHVTIEERENGQHRPRLAEVD
jgi:hypothetical protein